jgi:hypothetical protein
MHRLKGAAMEAKWAGKVDGVGAIIEKCLDD